ncbi:urea amidolyase [Exophiala viscosa]|uniref:urea amidolyase n=1 Tax=Exophiala viscosa TaxID=2486360 RepID=UPI00219D9F72|nr:urea amidolyase [Exophiala viscosa]
MGSSETPSRHLCRVLVANRGEIAVRLISTCKKLGISALTIYVDDDADSAHVRLADEAFLLAGHGSRGYTDIDGIVQICRKHHVQGVLPGYGFLSENAAFAKALYEAGILFIGTDSNTLIEFGLKHRARQLAVAANVPIVPGTEMLSGSEEALQEATRIGFPVMVKATAGGGGMGLQVCRDVHDLENAVAIVKSRGEALFKNDGFFIEKYVESGRHIEAQIFGNGKGDILFFGERECSIQRRHQKVIEETPSPYVLKCPSLRQKLKDASISLARSIHYKSVGTIEYLVDDTSGDFYFLEVNTRLQVEHGITEMCYDVDLVELMLLQAEEELRGHGGLSPEAMSTYARDSPKGHSIEVRVYAENPAKNYQPAPGLLQNVFFPQGKDVRIDTWVETGTFVSPHFDPLLAKVIVHSKDRAGATETLLHTLQETKLQGPPTNLDFLIQVLESTDFVTGYTTTSMLDSRFHYHMCAIEFVEPGTATTIQDWPGRVGIPNGVPPAGPMDALSFRMANLLVGNEEGTEGLEITMMGPRIRFLAPAVVALCGAPFTFEIDGQPASMWTRHTIATDSEVYIGDTQVGARAYLAVRGGFPNVATYLGSKSTTPSLNWGGYQGRRILAGDFLSIDSEAAGDLPPTPYQLDHAWCPSFGHEWRLAALPGPWFSDEYLTHEGQKHLFSSSYKVSFNSSRTGIRLEGPPPAWGRKDGGEGGSHPSNMVSFGCATGSVSFTGDSGVIMPVDGPNQTGFIVTHVVIRADMWKLGQLRPGDTVTFVPVTWTQAMSQERRLDDYVQSIGLQREPTSQPGTRAAMLTNLEATPSADHGDGVICKIDAEDDRPALILRQSGERAISCLYGTGNFDVKIRARIQQISNLIRNETPIGFERYLATEACSLLFHFDPELTTQVEAVRTILSLSQSIPDVTTSKIPSRMIHLPAVFDADECRETEQRYMVLQRAKAVYLPDNIDFIRRSNGLKTREDVKKSYFEVPYLVIAVGWLSGLPIYVQVDPRHRLVVPKYNPSRTFTKAGSLGTGGATSAIYPSDSPGGYQVWGVTIPGICWDVYGRKPGFSPSRPWLFEAFDQVVFHSVGRSEFDAAAKAFQAGRYQIRIEECVFDMAEYNKLYEETHEEVVHMKRMQEKCTEQELAKEMVLYDEWQEEVRRVQQSKEAEKKLRSEVSRDSSMIEVPATMISNVWKVEVQVGQVVGGGSVVVVLEAMKMEIAVRSPSGPGSYKVEGILKESGDTVEAGDVLILLSKVP